MASPPSPALPSSAPPAPSARSCARCWPSGDFPLSELVCLASPRSAGTRVRFGDEELEVRAVEADAFDGIDIAIFSAGATRSREWAPIAIERGAVVVDNSSAFRMQADVPLVVADVNPHALREHRGLVANPNCSTMQLMPVLRAIRDEAGLEHVTVSTYQSVSGTGRRPSTALHEETRSALAGEPPARLGLRGADRLQRAAAGRLVQRRRRLYRRGAEARQRDPQDPRAAGPARLRHLRARAGRDGPLGGRVGRDARRRSAPERLRELLRERAGHQGRRRPRAATPCRRRSTRSGNDDVWVGRIRRDLGRRTASPSGSSPTTCARARRRTPSTSPRCWCATTCSPAPGASDAYGRRARRPLAAPLPPQLPGPRQRGLFVADRHDAAQLQAHQLDAPGRAQRAEAEVGQEVAGEHGAVAQEARGERLALVVAVGERLDGRDAGIAHLADAGQEQALQRPRAGGVEQERARDDDGVARDGGPAGRSRRAGTRRTARTAASAISAARRRGRACPRPEALLDALRASAACPAGLAERARLPPDAVPAALRGVRHRRAREVVDVGGARCHAPSLRPARCAPPAPQRRIRPSGPCVAHASDRHGRSPIPAPAPTKSRRRPAPALACAPPTGRYQRATRARQYAAQSPYRIDDRRRTPALTPTGGSGSPR